MSNTPKIMKHGRVQLVDAPCVLVQYTDGHNKQETRIGFIVGDEVRFLNEDALSKEAQGWLRDDIFIALGLKEEGEKEVTTPGVLNKNIESSASEALETQV